MPFELERKLKRSARKKGLGKKRTGAYVYGNPVMKAWLKKHQRLRKKRK